MSARATNAASTPPESETGSVSVKSAAIRQLAKAACSSRKMPIARRQAGREHAPVQRLGGLVGADHLGVVLEREVRRGQPAVDVGGDGARVAPVRVEADVDPARHLVALDHGRRGADADVGDVLEPHVPAGGRVDQEVLDRR